MPRASLFIYRKGSRRLSIARYKPAYWWWIFGYWWPPKWLVHWREKKAAKDGDNG